ncbi:hypothetical protein HDV05_008693, partial [Chytridiales sp. JEL 0842]
AELEIHSQSIHNAPHLTMNEPTRPTTHPFLPSFLSCHPKNVLQSPASRSRLLASLQNGQPHILQKFSVVGMIDVSGYSALTSRLSVLGKLSSEVITREVGGYMAKVHKKAVQDHLRVGRGSAAVDSTSTSSTATATVTSQQMKTLRANLADFLSLSSNHHLTPSTFLKPDTQKSHPSIVSSALAADGADSGHLVLEIHVALTAGRDVDHVIFGLKDKRLDYVISGTCMKDLGVILDNTKKGELGLSNALLSHISPHVSKLLLKFASSCIQDPFDTAGIADPPPAPPFWTLASSSSSLERVYEAVCVFADAPLRDVHFNAVATIDSKSNPSDERFEESHVSAVEPTAQDTLDSQQAALVLMRLFLNESLLYKLESLQGLAKFQRLKNKRLSISALEHHTKKLTSLSRMAVVKGEFRRISVVFVKLLSVFEPTKAHLALSKFIEIPWTHEKDALHALRASIEFEDFAKATPTIGPISIAVATGEILYSTIGNAARKDASLLGDAVNIAARLLNIGLDSANTTIKCDAATFNATKEDFYFTLIGPQRLKGKEQAVNVWAVKPKMGAVPLGSPTEGSTQKGKNAIFGYLMERQTLRDVFQQWRTLGSPSLFVVEGKSGLGKSAMLEELTNVIQSAQVPFCLTQGTQIKQYTPYFSMNNLVNHIFQRFSTQLDQLSCLDDDTQSIRKSQVKATSTRQSVKSLDTYDSKNVNYTSKSQLVHIGQEDSDSMESRHKNAMVVLKKMNEDPKLAPLLNEVLPSLNITDTPYTKSMDGQTRRAVLKSLIVRIVTKCLALEKFVIIFDDAQWFDPISLDIISAISYNCPGALIYLFMRPLGEKPLPIYSLIFQSPNLQKVELGGLSKDDMRRILIHRLSFLGVEDISEDILKVVFEKSEGSPLIIDTIAELIKSQFATLFTLDSKGSLSLQDPQYLNQFDALDNFQTAVLGQFDRLDPQLQFLLRNACILGQYFDLEDLTFFYGDEVTAEELDNIITTHDTLSYLIRSESEGSSKYAYYFRHVQIMNAIYDSQPFSERVDLHCATAAYFESLVNSANREFLVPTICYHYRQTDDDDKKIAYLEEIGSHNFIKAHLREAIDAYDALLKLCKDNPKVTVSNERMALWMAHWTVIRVRLGSFTKEEYNACVSSMRLLGEEWPDDVKSAKKMILSKAIKLFSLWRRTNGGTKPLRKGLLGIFRKTPTEYVTDRKTVDTLLLCFIAMMRLGSFGKLLSKEFMAVLFLSQLNLLIPYGYCEKHSLASALYMVGFGLVVTLPTISKILFDNARKVEALIPSGESKDAVHAYYQFKGFHCITAGMIDEAITTAQLYIKYNEQRGDSLYVTMGFFILTIALTQKGDITSFDKELCEVSNCSNLFQWSVIAPIVTRRLMVLPLENARTEWQRLKLLQGVVHKDFEDACWTTPLAWLAYHDGEFPTALDLFEESCQKLSLFRQPYVTPGHILPSLTLLACMLVTPCTPFAPDSTLRAEKKRHVWTVEQRRRILGALDKMIDMLGFFYVKNRVVGQYAPWMLLQAIKLIFLGEKQKGLKMIINALKKKKSKAILDIYKFHQATAFTILGLHMDNKADRRHFYERALIFYKSAGFTYVEIWLVHSNGEGFVS